MQGDNSDQTQPVTLWWETRASLSAELQRTQPFRKSQPEERYFLLPDEDEEKALLYREDGIDKHHLVQGFELQQGPRINCWGVPDYLTALAELAELAESRNMALGNCAKRYGGIQLPQSNDKTEQRWLYDNNLGFRRAN